MNQPVPPLESSRRRLVFYYDGGCGFCRSGVRALSRLDFSHRVAWVSYQSLARPPDGLSWADLDRAAYLVDGAGVQHEGFFAFRRLTRILKPLLPLYPLLLLPGMDRLGVALYRRVARNRHRFWSRFSCSRQGSGGPPDP